MSIVFSSGSVPAFLGENDLRRRVHLVGRLAGADRSLAAMITVNGSGGILAGVLVGLRDEMMMQGLKRGELDQSLKIAPRIPILGLSEHTLPVDGRSRRRLLLFDGL